METHYTREYLLTRSVQDLKEICREKRLKGYTNNTKIELVYSILINQERRRRTRKFNIFDKFRTYMLRYCRAEEKSGYVHPEFIDETSEKEDELCVICFENKRIFAGKCGHLCLCGNCSKSVWDNKVSLCPICREEWREVRMIFL